MTKKIATRETYGETLVELGKNNENIVVLDADLSKSTKTYAFSKEFPNRFFNMGIAEQNLMGTAAGLAASGKIPFASTFALFASGRAFEIIRNSICYFFCHYLSPPSSCNALSLSSSFGAVPCHEASFSIKETPLPFIVLAIIIVGLPFVISACSKAFIISSKL